MDKRQPKCFHNGIKTLFLKKKTPRGTQGLRKSSAYSLIVICFRCKYNTFSSNHNTNTSKNSIKLMKILSSVCLS